MSLPIYQIANSPQINTLQTNWASIINPVVNNPITNGLILSNIPLINGVNVINHRLGRVLQGWIVIRAIGSTLTLYDEQNTNNNPQQTLILHSSGEGSVSLYVF